MKIESPPSLQLFDILQNWRKGNIRQSRGQVTIRRFQGRDDISDLLISHDILEKLTGAKSGQQLPPYPAVEVSEVVGSLRKAEVEIDCLIKAGFGNLARLIYQRLPTDKQEEFKKRYKLHGGLHGGHNITMLQRYILRDSVADLVVMREAYGDVAFAEWCKQPFANGLNAVQFAATLQISNPEILSIMCEAMGAIEFADECLRPLPNTLYSAVSFMSKKPNDAALAIIRGIIGPTALGDELVRQLPNSSSAVTWAAKSGAAETSAFIRETLGDSSYSMECLRQVSRGSSAITYAAIYSVDPGVMSCMRDAIGELLYAEECLRMLSESSDHNAISLAFLSNPKPEIFTCILEAIPDNQVVIAEFMRILPSSGRNLLQEAVLKTGRAQHLELLRETIGNEAFVKACLLSTHEEALSAVDLAIQYGDAETLAVIYDAMGIHEFVSKCLQGEAASQHLVPQNDDNNRLSRLLFLASINDPALRKACLPFRAEVTKAILGKAIDGDETYLEQVLDDPTSALGQFYRANNSSSFSRIFTGDRSGSKGMAEFNSFRSDPYRYRRSPSPG